MTIDADIIIFSLGLALTISVGVWFSIHKIAEAMTSATGRTRRASITYTEETKARRERQRKLDRIRARQYDRKKKQA